MIRYNRITLIVPLVAAFMSTLAAAADGYAPCEAEDQEYIDKPGFKARMDMVERFHTGLRIAALNNVPPGKAIADSLEVVVLPEPSHAEGFKALVRFAVARADFQGIYSEAELQLMSAIIQGLPQWLLDSPEDEQVRILQKAFERFYAKAHTIEDLTALDQRMGLCKNLHPHFGNRDVPDFEESAKAKMFLRRKLKLFSEKAPRHPVPAPPLPVSPVERF